MTPMHGIGGRQDLPLPYEFVVAGGAIALVATFMIVAFTLKQGDQARSRQLVLPDVLTRLIDHPGTRWTLRAVGFAVTVFMLWTLAAGPSSPLTNPVFGFVYVWVWVGIVPLSVFFGRVWLLLSPARTLIALAALVPALTRRQPIFTLPKRLGMWPAAAGLAAFIWLELVAPDRTTSSALMVWVAAFVVALAVGVMMFGPRWVEAADPFDNYARLLAQLSPWYRTPSGSLALRSPLANLSATAIRPGLVVFLCVLLASTAWDGFSGSRSLFDLLIGSSAPPLLLRTAGLTVFIAIVIVTFSVGAGASAHPPTVTRRHVIASFSHTLIPIAVGYVVAHYATLLTLEGQRVFINISDPLNIGWNLFGTAGWSVDDTITAYPGAIGSIQVAAIILGHIAGVILAHRHSLTLAGPRRALLGQLPMLVVMVGYTLAGLLLLFTE